VRRKFLKTTATESAHCKNSFIKTSFIHNRINWYLYSNGKELIRMPAQNINERFANVCDVPISRINHIKKIIGPIILEACFPFSENENKKKNNQFIYINNRAVTNRTIMHAIRSAFEEVTHGKNDSSIFLSLEMPNPLVDFNVHPCKTEVRFKDSSAVYEVVLTTLKDSFKNYAGERYTNEIVSVNPPKSSLYSYGQDNKINLSINSNSNEKQLSLKSSSKSAHENSAETYKTNVSINKVPPLGFALAQLHGIYILAENSSGLIVVDIHAAHERILFEKYKKTIECESLKTQKLISPILIQLNEDVMEVYDDHSSLISTMGFDVIKIDSKLLSLEGVPELTKSLDTQNILLEILEDLSKFGHAEEFDSKLMKFLGNLACKSAIKANRKMSIPEMNSLLRAMEGTDYGGKCNHGRPSWAELNLENIDKIFLRGR
jgi:DNA mismatch repair protein MutL